MPCVVTSHETVGGCRGGGCARGLAWPEQEPRAHQRAPGLPKKGPEEEDREEDDAAAEPPAYPHRGPA